MKHCMRQPLGKGCEALAPAGSGKHHARCSRPTQLKSFLTPLAAGAL